MVIAVPIPKEDEFRDPKVLNDCIQEAVKEAKYVHIYYMIILSVMYDKETYNVGTKVLKARM